VINQFHLQDTCRVLYNILYKTANLTYLINQIRWRSLSIAPKSHNIRLVNFVIISQTLNKVWWGLEKLFSFCWLNSYNDHPYRSNVSIANCIGNCLNTSLNHLAKLYGDQSIQSISRIRCRVLYNILHAKRLNFDLSHQPN
jgi:hypothetical protein